MNGFKEKYACLVSVIIPAYNVEDYVEKCLESIITQTYKNIEIIIIDDGSTDGTYEKCLKFTHIDHRVKLYTQKNKGVSAARNYGIERASGQYICFVDSDDQISPYYVEVMLKNIMDTNSDISLIQYTRHLPMDSLSNKEREVWNYKEGLIKCLSMTPPICCVCCKMYKKQILKDLRFDENIQIAEDKYFFYMSLTRCKKIVYQDIALYYYYERPGSAMRSSFDSKQLDRKRVNGKLYDMWCQQFPNSEAFFMKEKIMSSVKSIQESLRDNSPESKAIRKKFMEDVKSCKYRYIRKYCNFKERILFLMEKRCLFILKLYETIKLMINHI